MIDRNMLLANVEVKHSPSHTNCAVSRATFEGYAEVDLTDLNKDQRDTVLHACKLRAVDKVLDEIYGEIVVQLKALKTFNNAVAQPELEQALIELISRIDISH